MRMRLIAPAFALTAAVALLPASAPAQPKDDAFKTTVDKAVGYLKQAQSEDGSWSKAPNNSGVTGIVVTGMLRCGVKPEDAPAAKGRARRGWTARERGRSSRPWGPTRQSHRRRLLGSR